MQQPADENHDFFTGSRAGDMSSFEALYYNNRALVYAISKRMLDDAAAAEDVVQSVFFSVWRSPHAFRGGSLAAWLTSVAKNRARDALRARATNRETSYPSDLADQTRFDDDVHARLEMESVRSALGALPSAQRTLIELNFLGGRTHGELASMTSLPLGTVKTRIRDGIQALRRTLVA